MKNNENTITFWCFQSHEIQQLFHYNIRFCILTDFHLTDTQLESVSGALLINKWQLNLWLTEALENNFNGFVYSDIQDTNEDNVSFVFIRIKKDDPVNNNATISHECLHALDTLYTHLNMSPAFNEISAYLLGHMVEEVGRHVQPKAHNNKE